MQNKRSLFNQLMALVLILALGACSLDTGVEPTLRSTAFSPSRTPVPATATATQTPPATPTITSTPAVWDDRGIFTSGLQSEAQSALQQGGQASFYHITLDIPPDLPAPIPGTLTVRYFNQETIPLEEVYFRLFAFVYGGQLKVDDVRVNGKDVETVLESRKTALKVSLPIPLLVGESVVITMDFALHLPKSLEGSYGLLGYFNQTLTLDTFYPMIPAFDEEGWYKHYPYQNGDLTYNDASYYLVEVYAPADFVLATSGVKVSHTVIGKTQQVTYAAGPARDFYLAGSRDFIVMTEEINGITVNSYAQPGQETGQVVALTAALNALSTFSALFGDYPYTEFDVVNAPMLAFGIEYPGITNIYNELYNLEESALEGNALTILEFVIVHEVGHQWFYNVVGNDQQDHPWLDESVVQYITYLYVREQYGQNAARGNVLNWQLRLAGAEDPEKAVGLPSKEYVNGEYSGIVYGRGPLFLLELEETYGLEVVIAALRAYYQSHQWGQGEEATLRASLEAACQCDLTALFEEWIYPVDI
jgi:hypothetical protein